MAEPSSTTVKTRVLIISDTHNADLLSAEDGRERAFKQKLPKADVLLHCGDLTMKGLLHEYEDTLEMLGTIDAELKLVIAGNHDLSLDERFYHGESKGSGQMNGPRMHLGQYQEDMPNKALAMWTGDKAKNAGVTYLQEGTHTFTLKNGAKFSVYASPYTPEFFNWAFAYEHHEDRFNPKASVATDAVPIAVNPVPDFPDVDIMITHGPPHGVLDHTDTHMDAGCPHLLRAVHRARPRLHCFGHIHEGWGVQRLKWDAQEGGARSAASELCKGCTQATDVPINSSKMMEERSAYVDVSNESAEPLAHGEETLMVNASIMTVRYKPMNAPWLVDMELPRNDRSARKRRLGASGSMMAVDEEDPRNGLLAVKRRSQYTLEPKERKYQTATLRKSWDGFCGSA